MENKFYKTIREYYDYIFPLNNSQVKFVESEFSDINASLIEIGCANGKLTNALSHYDIMGVDLEESFIDIAKSRYLDIEFKAMNMLDLPSLDKSFDGIICFGNTLVHLSKNQISEFISACYNSLNSGGKLLIQILNYDNILDNNISKLPIIDNEHIRFVREYRLIDNDNLEFITELTIKESSETIDNSITLSPIRRDDLLEILEENGFVNCTTYGSFAKTPLKDDSLPFIISCEKP